MRNSSREKKTYTKVDVPRIKNKMTNVCNKERIGNLFAYTLTENACLAVFFSRLNKVKMVEVITKDRSIAKDRS